MKGIAFQLWCLVVLYAARSIQLALQHRANMDEVRRARQASEEAAARIAGKLVDTPSDWRH